MEEELRTTSLNSSDALSDSASQWENTHHDHRVVVIEDMHVWWAETPPDLNSVIINRAKDLVDRREHASQRQLPILREAVNYMARNDLSIPQRIDRQSRLPRSPLGQVAEIYGTRPNRPTQSFLQQEMERIFPPSYDPAQAFFGLPLRGTDKCVWEESGCMDFDQYMELAFQQRRKGLWKGSTLPGSNSSVLHPIHLVLKSEDASIINRCKEYAMNTSFPFLFVVNDHDTLQGTGFAATLKANHTADDVIRSTLTVIKMHLRTKKIIANCCSNFHNLIGNFVRRGTSKYRYAEFECLEDSEESRFRMC